MGVEPYQGFSGGERNRTGALFFVIEQGKILWD